MATPDDHAHSRIQPISKQLVRVLIEGIVAPEHIDLRDIQSSLSVQWNVAYLNLDYPAAWIIWHCQLLNSEHQNIDTVKFYLMQMERSGFLQ